MSLVDMLQIKTINKKSDEWLYEYNKNSYEYIGNKKEINELREWLINGSDKRALILSGPTGCGKTSLILLLCIENGIKYYFRDATNKRSKKDILLYHEEIKDFKNSVLIMDEMDIIINGEYMGLNDFKNKIKDNNNKKDSIRIIFIIMSIYLNKLIELKKICENVEMSYPNLSEMYKKSILIDKSCKKSAFNKIYNDCKGEPRTILNTIKYKINNTKDRDFEYNMYDSYDYLLNPNADLKSKLRVFSNECGTIPIILQENYIDWNISLETKKCIAKYLALADMFHKQAYNLNNENNVDIYCVISTLLSINVALFNNVNAFPKKKPRFGLIWTKQSAMFQKKKYLTNLLNQMNVPELDIYTAYNIRKEFEQIIESNDKEQLKKQMLKYNFKQSNLIELFNLFNFNESETNYKKLFKSMV